jgi:methionine-rich copper-binding protein CopC
MAMKLRLIAVASVLFLLLPSAAHANSLVEASPASGAVLGLAPNAVSVTGSSTLQADGNQLSVIDPKGNPVDDGSITVTDASVVVGLKPLTAAGVYTVSYTLLAAGEAPLQGSYTFLFNAPADMASATPTPTPTISKTGGATSSSNGAAIFVVVIFLLGCSVLLFLFWYARTLWRQTQRRKRKATKKKSAPSTRA